MTDMMTEKKFRVDENGWTWIPVEHILRETDSSCDWPDGDFTWEDMLEFKCKDTGFMHLVWSIMEHGWTSAIGWSFGEITEGHHRLAAAILLCEDEVPVTSQGTDDFDNYVEAHVNFSDPQPLYLEV